METLLDLDSILAESKQDGVLQRVDDRWTQRKVYRFILEGTLANEIVEQLIAEFIQNPLYGLIPGESKVIDDGYRIEFGYRKLQADKKKTRLLSLGNLTQNVLSGSEHYADLNHFATILVLDLPLEEKLRLERESKDPKGKSVFVMDTLDTRNSQQANLHLMRTFYSAYKNLKTPSKT
ncbi:hypothetical protein HYX05_04535 [Candidatus Woesearchaeota archaeon]|nr:hypothetical protein [Candidatus Woesearchaeota archaeon]